MTLGFGTGRQKGVLERWTNPKPRRRTCTSQYGVLSCRGKSAGVANGPVSDLPPESLNVTIRNFCVAAGGAAAGHGGGAAYPRAAGRERGAPGAHHGGGGDTTIKKLRIVTLRISGGRSLTGPLRDARRFASTRWCPVPGATRTTSGFGICPSFKDHLCRAVPNPNCTTGETFASLQVISAQLVEFGSAAELVSQNRKLLAVVRQLAEEREAEAAQLKAQFDAELQAAAGKAMRQLAELRTQREQREEFVTTIVRQRDMYRSMLQSTGGAVPAVVSPALSPGGAKGGVEAPDYTAAVKEAHAEVFAPPVKVTHITSHPDAVSLDLDQGVAPGCLQVERVAAEGKETVRTLHAQLDEYRAEAAAARTSKNNAEAEAEFQGARYGRLQEAVDAQREELNRANALAAQMSQVSWGATVLPCPQATRGAAVKGGLSPVSNAYCARVNGCIYPSVPESNACVSWCGWYPPYQDPNPNPNPNPYPTRRCPSTRRRRAPRRRRASRRRTRHARRRGRYVIVLGLGGGSFGFSHHHPSHIDGAYMAPVS